MGVILSACSLPPLFSTAPRPLLREINQTMPAMMAPMSTTPPTAPPMIGPILTEDFRRGVLDGDVVCDDAAEDVRVKLSEPAGEPAATSGRPGDNGSVDHIDIENRSIK
jgi:hypothetical protein